MSGRALMRRRAAIESLMSDRSEVDILSLAEHFGVSQMTIRRDLEVLEADGVIQRLVGGRAVMVDPKNREPALSTRAVSESHSKAHIGQAAANIIADGEVIFIDGGSTALAVARALRETDKALTVLTRSLLVAAELSSDPRIDILLLGGRLKASEMSTTSSTLADDLQNYNVDTYIMGISGVHLTRGLTDYDPDESAGKRLAIERADRVLLVCDHSKLGRVVMSRVAGLDDVDIVVTDANPRDETLTSMPSTIKIVLVEPNSDLAQTA